MHTPRCCLLALIIGGLAVAREVSPRVTEALADLRSASTAVRINAVRVLGETRAQEAVAPLRGLTTHDEARTRAEAARALGQIRSPDAVPELIDALTDADVNVRFYAAHALGEIRDRRTAKPLLRVVAGDPEWTVRDQAAWALREVGVDPLITTLIEMLSTGMDPADGPIDRTHVQWLVSHASAEAAVGPLQKLLLSNATTAVRRRALEALVGIGGPPVVPALIGALRDADLVIRRDAVAALVPLHDPRATEALKALARRESDEEFKAHLEKALLALSLHPSLKGYWGFDDRDPSTVRDVTGRGNDGRNKGCTYVDGRAGAALRFANGSFVELGQPPELNMGGTPFTIMAWAKPETRTGVIVARGGAFCGFSLYVLDGIPKFGIHLVQDGPGYITAGAAPLGTGWVHLAGVVHRNRIDVFVDGRLAGSAKTAGFVPGNAGQGMEFGFDVSNSPAEICDAFTGLIDEVMFFGTALTPEEIRKTMAAANR